MYDIHVGSDGQLVGGELNPSAVSRLIATRGRQAAACESHEFGILDTDFERLGVVSPLLVINANYVSPPQIKPLISRYMLQAAARELMPNERVAKCLRVPVGSSVDVLYAAAVKAAHYRGLFTCTSVWMCPPCATKISERRRVELQQAIENWQGMGGLVVMATFTLRHTAEDVLEVLVEAFSGALRRVRQGSAWGRLVARFGLVGSVRALEVTHGFEHGWHPHAHVLLFVDGAADVAGLTDALRTRWIAFLAKRGFDATWEQGVHVRVADNAAGDYVAKLGSEWTVAHEMTKAGIKRAAGENRTVAQLLADYAVNGDQRAGELWQEYARVFKGKRHLQWSDGLRALLLPEAEPELSDAELAAVVEQDAVVLASLTVAQWRVIVANDCRAELLLVAASGDVVAVWAFLGELGIIPPGG